MKLKITDEQKEIINQSFNNNTTLVNALAGTGKTTTCFEIIKKAVENGMKVLYLVFNKAMEAEAKQKAKQLKLVGDNVDIKTVHALAYRYLARIGYFREYKVGNIRVKDLHDCFMSEYSRCFFLLKIFNEFLYSQYSLNQAADFLNELTQNSSFWGNITKEYSIKPEDIDEIIDLVENKRLLTPYDYYLKKFIDLLNKKKLSCYYDVVILDESQDANPCFASLLKAIKCRHRIMVGDRHQWIYGFRGSVNLMEQFEDAKRLYLTTTFRFDERIAQYANIILRLKGEKYLLKTQKTKQAEKQKAYISRTNSKLLELYLSMNSVLRENIIFERGIEEIIKLPLTISLILEGFNPYSFCSLQDLPVNKVIDEGFYRMFANKYELTSYINEIKSLNLLDDNGGKTETEVVTAFQLACEYGAKGILSILRQYNRQKHDRQDAIYFSTAHSAKGQEYRSVLLLNDFLEIIEPGDKVTICQSDTNGSGSLPKQYKEELILKLRKAIPEINLLYVTLTRASDELHISEKVEEILRFYDILVRQKIKMKDIKNRDNKDKKSEKDKNNRKTIKTKDRSMVYA